MDYIYIEQFSNFSITQSSLQHKSAFTQSHTLSHTNDRWPLHTLPNIRKLYRHTLTPI